MSKKDQAKSLYDKINQAYRPVYFPTEEEKNEAINFLVMSLYGNDIKENDVVKKAQILSKLHGNHKSKVTSLIMNKFWTMKIDYGVMPQKFKEE